MLDIRSLVITTAVNTKIGWDENKIPDVPGLVKKTHFKANISGTESKYFTTSKLIIFWVKYSIQN